MGTLVSVLKLARIEHSIMLIIAIVAAELLAGGILPGVWIFLASVVTAVFISAGAFAINDYFDIGVDRENKKKRPLVTGELSKRAALYVVVFCMVVGIAASALINADCVAIAVIFGVLSLLYAYRLKDVPLVGNMYVALSMAIPFIFGSYVVSQSISPVIIVISLLVFTSGLAREIDGTIRDFKGDLRRKAVTLPRVVGIRNSAYISLILYIIAVCLSVYLFLYVPPFMGNMLYAALITIADLMLLYSGAVYALMLEKKYDSVRDISLAGMALALVCILLSIFA